MAAAGVPGLTPVDVLVLHAANHRDREKTLADICMIYNIEDTHVVSYAVKKLAGRGLVATGRRGKEKTVKVTEEGAQACRRYRDLREALLVSPVGGLNLDAEEISRVCGADEGTVRPIRPGGACGGQHVADGHLSASFGNAAVSFRNVS